MLDSPPNPYSIVTVGHIETEVICRGEGRPLLFLHPEIGLVLSAAVLGEMARDFSVIAPSLPGYGRTDLPRAWNSVDDFAYFVLDFMDALNLRGTVLVGVGIGGWIAAEVATKTCERIAALVLANPAGIKTGNREHRDMLDIFALPQSELERSSFHDASLARFDPRVASEEQIFIRLRDRETTVLLGWSPYMHNPKLAGRLHRIRVPSLVLWGDSDRIAAAEYGRSFAERIPGARFQMLAKAGRFAHLEQPEAFARAVAEFAAAIPAVG